MSDDVLVRDEQHHGGAATGDTTDDVVVYLSSDKMGESSLQFYVNSLLVLLLRDYFAAEGRAAFVSSNQFFYYRRGDPRSSVSPDLYVIDGEARHPASVPSWKVWEHDGRVPALVIEVVSDEYRKDYAGELVERYQQLGIGELVRYDPGHGGRANRSLLTHWVRQESGQLVRQRPLTDRVRSAIFGVWFVVRPDKSLRLALGPHGEALWPTPDEKAAEAERQAAEAERQAAEAERQAAEAGLRASEAERQAAESARQVAEAARQVAEAARQVAEAERQAAESARQAAESAREAAEEAAMRRAVEVENEQLRAELAALRGR